MPTDLVTFYQKPPGAVSWAFEYSPQVWPLEMEWAPVAATEAAPVPACWTVEVTSPGPGYIRAWAVAEDGTRSAEPSNLKAVPEPGFLLLLLSGLVALALFGLQRRRRARQARRLGRALGAGGGSTTRAG